jgi:hypothetical protein
LIEQRTEIVQPELAKPEVFTPTTVTFHKVYPAAISPMRADKAALGTLPTMAYRHCEPVRTASSFGWYIFPPEDIFLKWNGSDTYILLDGEWQILQSHQLPEFGDYWDKYAPPDMQGLSPAYISNLPVKGFVQIWSGLLCSTAPDWSLLVRPLVNMRSSHTFSCFEGLIETDLHQPFPLFINLQLLATDVVIQIPKTAPLFQVQPLMRATYSAGAHEFAVKEGLMPDADGLSAMQPEHWAGYRKTIRVDNPHKGEFEKGQYTNATRRRTKHDDE